MVWEVHPMEIFVLPLNDGVRSTKRERGCIVLIRALALTVGALTMASCASTKPLPPAPFNSVVKQDPSALTRTALRNFLQAKPGAGAAQPARLRTFYEERDYRPVWTGDLMGERAAAEVRSALARAHEQGLRDEEYKLPPAARLAPGAQAAAYDIAITGPLLRYASDVRTGRMNPYDVYEDADLPATKFDPVALLSAALNNGSMPRFFAVLAPPHSEYRRLAAALAHYRTIDDEGGWPTIADGGEVKFDGKDTRLAALRERLAVE